MMGRRPLLASKPCLHCGAEMIAIPSHVARRRFCSRACSARYRYVTASVVTREAFHQRGNRASAEARREKWSRMTERERACFDKGYLAGYQAKRREERDHG